MDKKVFIQALLWSLVAFMVWQMIAIRLWPPQPAEPVPSPPATAPAAPESPAAEAPSAGAPAEAPPGKFRAVTTEEEITLSLGNGSGSEDSPFRMALGLSNRGAAVRYADLSDFAEAVNEPARYRLLNPVPGLQDREFLSLALENVNIDGQDVPLAGARWRASKSPGRSSETATFEMDIADDAGTPVLRLTRTYELPAQPADAKRFDLFVDLSVENLTDQQHDVRVTERGPLGIRQAYSRAEDRFVYAALVSPAQTGVVVEGKSAGDVAKTTQVLDTPDTPERLLWVGVGNKYFSCILVPLGADGGESPPHLEQADAVQLGGDAGSPEGITPRLVSRFTLQPHTAWVQKLACYLGPNDKEAFTRRSNGDYLRRDFRQIITVQYGWCAFGWLTDLMILFLDGLESVFRNYGVAIIILVLVVRAILHPVTKKGQVNMVRMQERMGKLQPKLELLKEKFGNDKVRLQQEQMKLYKEEGVNPATSMFSSCLPMVIQMPIWIALYTSLSNNIAMRHQPFVLWIDDLTAPDALIKFSHSYTIPLLGALMGEVKSFNLLPILLAISMIVQQKLMPKPQPPKGTGKTGSTPQIDQAAQMQKMMPIMSVFFAFILYPMPSGLNLYIMASNVFGTIEQWRIRKHIKEAKEKGPDAPAPREKGPHRPKRPSWITKKFQELQRRADQAQRVQSHRKGKRSVP